MAMAAIYIDYFAAEESMQAELMQLQLVSTVTGTSSRRDREPGLPLSVSSNKNILIEYYSYCRTNILCKKYTEYYVGWIKLRVVEYGIDFVVVRLAICLRLGVLGLVKRPRQQHLQ